MALSNYSPAARAALASTFQPSLAFTAVTVDSVDGTIPAGGTGAAAGGWDTNTNRDLAIVTATETLTSLNEMITKLGTMGLPITAS